MASSRDGGERLEHGAALARLGRDWGALSRSVLRERKIQEDACDAPRPEIQMPSMDSGFRQVFCLLVAFPFASCALHHVIMSICNPS